MRCLILTDMVFSNLQVRLSNSFMQLLLIISLSNNNISERIIVFMLLCNVQHELMKWECVTSLLHHDVDLIISPWMIWWCVRMLVRAEDRCLGYWVGMYSLRRAVHLIFITRTKTCRSVRPGGVVQGMCLWLTLEKCYWAQLPVTCSFLRFTQHSQLPDINVVSMTHFYHVLKYKTCRKNRKYCLLHLLFGHVSMLTQQHHIKISDAARCRSADIKRTTSSHVILSLYDSSMNSL